VADAVIEAQSRLMYLSL